MLKIVSTLIAVSSLAFFPVLGSAQSRPFTVLVPGGTSVPVHVLGEVSSSKVKDGDTFQVQAAQDVVVNGMVVVRNGALGQGTIGEVDQAGGNGHSGALTLNFDWIYSVDGGKIRLAQVRKSKPRTTAKAPLPRRRSSALRPSASAVFSVTTSPTVRK